MENNETKNKSQYVIGDCTYTINRVFNSKKDIKEIITDKIIMQNMKSQN